MTDRPTIDGKARDLLDRGRRLRHDQQTEAAVAAIDAAATLAPDDAGIALAMARIHFDTWRPAADLFGRARALLPHDLDRLSGHAAALVAEGQVAEAASMLDDAILRSPDWVDGHRQLAQVRLISGEASAFDDGFARSCSGEDETLPLRLAWFHLLATARDWPRARRVLEDGRRKFGAQRALDLCALFLASESDEASRDPDLFADVADIRDPGLDLCQVRFWLRNGRPDRATAIAMRQIDGPAARTFWPYLSLAWRLDGDARAAWLDGDGDYNSIIDAVVPADERPPLATLMRELLSSGRTAPEQSVRGGVQTDRNLFFHHDPRIQRLRAQVAAAVETYIAALPPPVPGHPLLDGARGSVRFEGSWTVLLRGAGHHAPHTHSRGWISSALYLELPAFDTETDAQAGWIEFGTPPAELNLDLPPQMQIAPQPGRLVLFPSTAWHRTRSFTHGDRLTIAFDASV